MLHWTKWWKNELTYKVTKYPSRGTLTKEEVDGETRAALSIWEAETNMKFVKKDSGKADIEISYVEGEHGDDPFDGPGKTLAHAFFPISGGDIHMDDEEDWTINSYEGTNLLWTLTHELGHSLGIKHSKEPGSLMASYLPKFDPHRGVKLHQDDIDAIRALYGTKNESSTTTSTTISTPTVATSHFSTSSTATTTTSTTIKKHISLTTTSSHSSNPKKISICSDPSIDVITGSTDGTAFVFRKSFYWKLEKYHNKMSIAPGYPRKIMDDWKGLPPDLDAGFTWKKDIFFFKKNSYWKFHYEFPAKYVPFENNPINIQKGFPGIPDDLDAAFVWGGNKKFYFFKDKKYWMFDPASGQASTNGYPKDISKWGVPSNIEGAFLHSNGKTYFFKNGVYWKFNDEWKSVDMADPKFPRDTKKWWFGCDKENDPVSIFLS